MSYFECEVIRLLKEQVVLLTQIRDKIAQPQRLSSIKIRFKDMGGCMPEGPVTLNVGQTTTATVDGFDQNGAPFTGTVPPATFSVDNPAIATVDPTSGLVTAVSAGVANVTATLITAEGTTLTDTETVTVRGTPPPPQVLSSIKINFSTPV